MGGKSDPRIPNDFEIVDELGHGGFATVYRARQKRLDRFVALKLFNLRLLDERQAERFKTECHAMGRLDGVSHIVQIYDANVPEDGRPYIAMRLYPGGSLADRIVEGGLLAPWEVADIGVRLAAALQRAHDEHIVHRDVKPQNILFADDGTPALGDFGVAVISDRVASEARTQAYTLQHVAPEVLQGAAGSSKADIYGLASSLYAAAAGRPAFGATAVAALIASVVEQEPARLPGPAAPLDDVLRRGLAKSPGERPVDAARFACELQEVQRRNGWPVTAISTTDGAPLRPAGSTPPLPPRHASALYESPTHQADSRPAGSATTDFSEAATHLADVPSSPSGVPVRRVLMAVGGIFGFLFLLGAAWAVVGQFRTPAPSSAAPAPSSAGGTAKADSSPTAARTSPAAVTLGVDETLPAPSDVHAVAGSAGRLTVSWQSPVSQDPFLVRVVVAGKPTPVSADVSSLSVAASPDDGVCVEAVYLGVGRSSCTVAS